MSDTPRTDAVGDMLGNALEVSLGSITSIKELGQACGMMMASMKDHGRQLERELTTSQQANAELRKELDEAYEKSALICDPLADDDREAARVMRTCARMIRALKSTATKRDG